ncbi:thiamine phosphate synthase, partial [Candidatus Sumerlaeota bacterium]|nr:thiamine phosphate synthase [Candidatus Sumerlaeota bacterium]
MRKKDIFGRPGLYVITDRRLAGGCEYLKIVRAVLLGGARIIQLRDKETPFEELVKVGKKIKNLCAEFNATLIVNDNPYLAREIDADGVHLGQTDMPVDIAREIIGKDKIIGLSTHNYKQITQAMMMDEVDYIGIGPIFPTSTKKSEYPPVGLKILRWAAENCHLPFVAIGGINKENIAQVLATGTKLIAVVSAVMSAPDITTATR